MFPPSVVYPPPVPVAETPQPPPLASTSDGATRQQIPASSAHMSQIRGFPFHDLKWTTSHTNTQRSRKAAEISSDPVPVVRRGIPVNENTSSRVSSSVSEKNPDKKKGISAGDLDRSLEKKSTAVNERSKILIRIPNPKNCKDAADSSDLGAAALDAEENPRADGQNLISGDDTELDEFVTKTWNLRPRRPPPKRSNGYNGGASTHDNKAQVVSANRAESSRPRNSADEKITGESKKKKPKLSISLTKMEIEEDIFALTGSKPSRRPKKRAKHVQKQLDGLFPGLWLGSITHEAYKVSEHATKEFVGN